MWSIEMVPLTDTEAVATLRMLGLVVDINGLKAGNYRNSSGQILKVAEV